jgi:hypothetical protein
VPKRSSTESESVPRERRGPAPRLFVIMATDAPVAVVVRRGPTAWAQITSWDTREDVFTEGAWFRGRIFAEKCDISPDGQLLVYAAYKGDHLRTNYTDSWTAVSRPPWLHALALWPMGTTYGGGGHFVGNRELVLRGAREAHPDHPPRGLTLVRGEAPYHRSAEEIPGVEWTGRDQENRLVFAARGCIFARTGGDDRLLADFSAQVPNATPAPEWARQPLTEATLERPRRRKK